MAAVKKEIYADGACIHGILVQDVCFDCELRLLSSVTASARKVAVKPCKHGYWLKGGKCKSNVCN